MARRALPSLLVSFAFSALAIAGCASHAQKPAVARTCACTAGQACVNLQCKDTQRIVSWAVATAYVTRGARSIDALPTEARLGAAEEREARLLLRFAVDVPPGATIVAAHVLLDRAPSVDADPAPLALRAARIVDAWDARSIPWARAPRLESGVAPVTWALPEERVVRVDVTNLARRWRRHASEDRGIAIVAESATPSGMTFALAPGDADADTDRLAASAVTPIGPPTLFVRDSKQKTYESQVTSALPPRLEMYVSL